MGWDQKVTRLSIRLQTDSPLYGPVGTSPNGDTGRVANALRWALLHKSGEGIHRVTPM